MAEIGRRPPPLDPASNDVQSSNEIQSTESRMRRALGLTATAGSQVAQQRPEQARARHRFVQDGGVPVVMLGHKAEPETAALRERIGVLEGALEAERANHAGTKRSLNEQYASAQALQTRLAHAELAHTEALEAERRLRRAAQQAVTEAQAASQVSVPIRRVKLAEHAVTQAEQEVLPLIDVEPVRKIVKVAAGRRVAEAPVAEKAKRGRPRINPLPEPKPVRWWTPSFRAKTKG